MASKARRGGRRGKTSRKGSNGSKRRSIIFREVALTVASVVIGAGIQRAAISFVAKGATKGGGVAAGFVGRKLSGKLSKAEIAAAFKRAKFFLMRGNKTFMPERIYQQFRQAKTRKAMDQAFRALRLWLK